jgi:hypothetical protein
MKINRFATSLFTLSVLFAMPVYLAAAPVIKKITVDKSHQRIAIEGSGLAGASFTVGGIAVLATNVSDTLQFLPFGAELASAVPREGSYSLVVNGSKKSVFYTDAQILAPPPTNGTACPCISGWESSGIPMDNWTWCVPAIDGTQVSLSGSRDQFFITAAFDPNHIDANNSFCALHDGTTWSVYQAIGDWNQYDDCESWMWLYICI